MGETGAHALDEPFVIAVDGHGQSTRQVVLQLDGIRHRLAALAKIGKGPGQQVGVPALSETEDHGGTHIKGVSLSVEAASRSSWDQIALQNQRFCPFHGQLGGGDQTADPGADHNHVPGGVGHSWCQSQR